MTRAREVARRAGVSTTTVSHVVNGSRFVSAGLTERVVTAILELGYEPDAVARSLKTKRSQMLGLVIPDIQNPFFTAVVRGVEDVAQECGYTLILCHSDENPAKEAAYIRILRSKRVDGMILAPTGQLSEAIVNLAHNRYPLVFLDREVPGLDVSVVALDNRGAADDATRHLVEHGHRRIAMVAGGTGLTSMTERLEGYASALQHAGIPYEDGLVVDGHSRTEDARRATASLLDRDPTPSAFFVGNNLMTIGAVAAILDRGLAIPDDVALVSVDDFDWADLFRPRLTVITQPTYNLGRKAGEMLIQAVADGSQSPPTRVCLSGRLTVRDSCGCGSVGRIASTGVGPPS